MTPLRCRVPGCKTVFRGVFTGLQELKKLQQHMKRTHFTTWDIVQAAEWRAKWEREQIEEEK